MKNKGILNVQIWLMQKKKRPQEGGVGPKILSSAGLIHLTIGIVIALVKRFLGDER
ncbi:MAG: ABC-type phosphate transport system permease subunit [Candidatus Endobugula sp.]|jgi:ABC-type phosphate transport system permease subunit